MNPYVEFWNYVELQSVTEENFPFAECEQTFTFHFVYSGSAIIQELFDNSFTWKGDYIKMIRLNKNAVHAK